MHRLHRQSTVLLCHRVPQREVRHYRVRQALRLFIGHNQYKNLRLFRKQRLELHRRFIVHRIVPKPYSHEPE